MMLINKETGFKECLIRDVEISISDLFWKEVNSTKRRTVQYKVDMIP